MKISEAEVLDVIESFERTLAGITAVLTGRRHRRREYQGEGLYALTKTHVAPHLARLVEKGTVVSYKNSKGQTVYRLPNPMASYHSPRTAAQRPFYGGRYYGC